MIAINSNMITFKHYIIREGKLKDSKKVLKLGDYPMFTVFIAKGDNISERLMAYKENEDYYSKAFELARERITRLGLPSMHVNVVFKDTPDAYGLAHGNPDTKTSVVRSVSLSVRFIDFGSRPSMDNIKYSFSALVDTIVHEWAHMWMFNNGKAFRDAIKQYHEALVYSNIDKIPYNYGDTERIFTTFYKDIAILFKTYKFNLKENPQYMSLKSVRKDMQRIFLDTLNEYGMYALAVDKDVLNPYIDKISDIVYHNVGKNPKSVFKYIEGLNLEKVFEGQIKQETQRSISKRSDIRKQLSDMIRFTGAYGMTNPDEAWATAIEKFKILDPYHKKRIRELMRVKGSRNLPNRRIKKYKRQNLNTQTLDDLMIKSNNPTFKVGDVFSGKVHENWENAKYKIIDITPPDIMIKSIDSKIGHKAILKVSKLEDMYKRGIIKLDN